MLGDASSRTSPGAREKGPELIKDLYGSRVVVWMSGGSSEPEFILESEHSC